MMRNAYTCIMLINNNNWVQVGMYVGHVNYIYLLSSTVFCIRCVNALVILVLINNCVYMYLLIVVLRVSD